MVKISFYVMNAKGYFVLKEFINKFGSDCIDYVISSEDKNVEQDFFDEIKNLAKKEKIKFFNRVQEYSYVEEQFDGFKFVVGWRWLIKNELKLIVFHDSLLPKYRGFSPLVNSLINNEKVLGVTALFASSDYDKGDIIAQKSFNVQYPIKIEFAINKIKILYFELVDQIYSNLSQGSLLNRSPQIENDATYSVWLDNEDYFIDWSWSSCKIKRFVDSIGFPYNGAKAYLDGAVVQVVELDVIMDVIVESRERHIGKVVFIKNGVPIVICGEGLIGIKTLKDSDGKDMIVSFRSRFK